MRHARPKAAIDGARPKTPFRRVTWMSPSETNQNSVEETFSLVVDQYEHLWLETKLEGLPLAIDLGPRDAAFEIMAATMSESGFEYHPVHGHEAADNDE